MHSSVRRDMLQLLCCTQHGAEVFLGPEVRHSLQPAHMQHLLLVGSLSSSASWEERCLYGGCPKNHHKSKQDNQDGAKTVSKLSRVPHDGCTLGKQPLKSHELGTLISYPLSVPSARRQVWVLQRAHFSLVCGLIAWRIEPVLDRQQGQY